MSEAKTPAADALIEAARRAREGAVCGYSGFAVGAALEDDQGRVWTGANVENASYNLGLCAERVALFHALTRGARGFRRVVVVTGADHPTPPCGACRQVLAEFAPKATVTMVAAGGTEEATVAELVPRAFTAASLDSPGD